MIVQAGRRRLDARELRVLRAEAAVVARYISELTSGSPRSEAREPDEQR
jgi:hypothetical protein